MSGEPRVLQELGRELDRAARRSLAARWGAGRMPRRLSLVAVAIVLLAMAAVAAAAIVISSGPPLPAPHAQDLESGGVPVPSSVHLAGLDAPDPEGGAAPWDIRLSRTRAGETCSAVGQVVDGQFGIVGLDHVFRVLPLGGVDACGIAVADGPILAGAKVFAGASAQEARTVVNGVAGPGVRSVTAYGAEGSRPLALGPDGSFITVFRGYVEEVRPRIVVVDRGGARHTVEFAQSSGFETPDPQGGSPWEVSGEADIESGAYADENCAQVSRARGRTNPSFFDSSLTPSICGRLGVNPLFVSIRRFDPGTGEHTGFPWGNNPARTLVYGAASRRVSSLALTGAGAARVVPIDPHDGVFLAVLDGHVNPASLTLSAHLRDGQTVLYKHSANLLAPRTNQPVVESAVPAYREPAPPTQTPFPAFEILLAGTLREAIGVPDPAGGAGWVLRSWQGTPNPKAGDFGSGAHARFLCFQVGVRDAGRLVVPSTGGAPVPLAKPGVLSDNSGEERCNQVRDLARKGPLFSAETYLEDPYAYAPRPLRTVVSGQLPVGASHAMLVGAGRPRPITVDANHAFLVVLPGRYWAASLTVTESIDGRAPTPRLRASVAHRANAAPEARAPDPDGASPWGFRVNPNGSSEYGRIVDGRLASIDEREGKLESEPVEWSSRVAPQPGGRPQVALGLAPADQANLLHPTGEALSRPEIERRTLPGRTVITGIAQSDVLSVTLQTPRDVRTLRPSGPHHVLIAVYDGQFFRGIVTATVRLRDGRTVTEPLFGGPGVGGVPPARSLTRMLALIRRDASAMAADESLAPAARRRALAAQQFAVREQAIERRLAYEREHPGVLPGA